MSSKNIFAALEKPKKKKSSSDKPKKAEKPAEPEVDHEELERAIFSQPAIGISNWASDDEDDEPGHHHHHHQEEEEEGWSKVSQTEF